MNVFGSTRSTVQRNHALICPDSFVQSPLPGWTKTQSVMLISPQMGARFTQYLALLEAGGCGGVLAPSLERFVYVLDGELRLLLPDGHHHTLESGGFAYFPPGFEHAFAAKLPTRVNCFEKRFVPFRNQPPPEPVFGREQDVEGKPFLGDPDAVLKTFLPDDSAYDLAVNLFTYQPGATLPMVEVHVMEHGLLMLQGQGVYRLGDAWYPVREGDIIWMAPYCPQWFVAMGKEPARYLYYKDVNRPLLETVP